MSKAQRNNSVETDIPVVLTFVPQGQMVKPRTYIATISSKGITNFLINEIKNNTPLRKLLKEAL